MTPTRPADYYTFAFSDSPAGSASVQVNYTAQGEFIGSAQGAGHVVTGTIDFSVRQIHGGVVTCQLSGQSTFTACRQ